MKYLLVTIVFCYGILFFSPVFGQRAKYIGYYFSSTCNSEIIQGASVKIDSWGPDAIAFTIDSFRYSYFTSIDNKIKDGISRQCESHKQSGTWSLNNLNILLQFTDGSKKVVSIDYNSVCGEKLPMLIFDNNHFEKVSNDLH